jgi:hypothetical protein
VDTVLAGKQNSKSGGGRGRVFRDPQWIQESPRVHCWAPPLFTIYIDDLDEMAMLIELILKFADDTKGLKEITSEEDARKLQETLDRLCEWARKWAMSYNIPKCKIMHVGRNNPRYKYYMEGEELKTV